MTEPSKPEQSTWMRIVQEDAGHSAAYVQRFRNLAAQGRDLVGEARLVDAMLSRGSRVLDAGCGPGRVGAYLHEVGHDVVGVDADPVLIAAAEEDHPGPRWLAGDLAELDLPAVGITEPFDAIVCAGNVMTFLATSTRGAVLRRVRPHLRAGGGGGARGGGGGGRSGSAAVAATGSTSSSPTPGRPPGSRTCCCPRGTCGRSLPTPISWSPSSVPPEPGLPLPQPVPFLRRAARQGQRRTARRLRFGRCGLVLQPHLSRLAAAWLRG